MAKKILYNDLSSLKAKHSESKIVHCHGTFDLFHFGHLLHLRSAKKFGDILVVTVTPDEFVNKGPGRPRYSSAQRVEILSSIDFVDYVCLNNSATAVNPILELRPDFYVKGPDYIDQEKDITGKIFEEEAAIKHVSGSMVFTEDDTMSSTELINSYFNPFDLNQINAIESIKKLLNPSSFEKILQEFSNLNVLVIGEPIVDTYIFCKAEGVSSKSPSISARYLYQEDYAGGTLAIANHLAALNCKVSLAIPNGNEAYFNKLLDTSLDKKIKLYDFKYNDFITPRKSRYLSHFKQQKIFEITNISNNMWANNSVNEICEFIRSEASNFDIVLIADFGHGLFEGKLLESLSSIKTFVALNVQTNSSNFGFNPFTKHKRYDYLSIDENECRIGTHDRLSDVEVLAEKIVQNNLQSTHSITLGTAGSLYLNKSQDRFYCPTFIKDSTIDTTGAGDAYLAITTLLVKLNVDEKIIPFIGNCFAGLKTKIIGNKSSVNKIDLIRTVSHMLK
ncbi:adenylyltransferase/cytidyltransferase family protein [Silvanigrella paludirubra]|uniref:Adenylyltransferase/cytidyltransferase family protein n=1 Tax=Silvanigrella paludirubra TaxID=2499159 RepID=A0A6N6VTP6_9BACT|nr:PfkB family carbohydrate kinase [Silvanigrella paludirubra]KAB8036819.1 adenylyltransferase/cytidyltransferase family protein [Silvanigrella paludirubra]